MSAIETLGGVFPNLIFEAVTNPHGDLRLHTWNGRRSTTTDELKHGGGTYIPAKLPVGLIPLVRFAPPSSSYGSTKELFDALRNFFSQYLRLQPEVVAMLLAFALATWFCDCLTVAPILYLFGPDDTVSTALRLLSCVCRRAVRLGDIDLGGLATLPAGLGATLLMNQRDLGRRVRRTLLASTRRHFFVVRGNRRLDLYGAKVFSCEDCVYDEPGFTAWLSPAQNPPPILTDAEENVIAQNFQSKLLRYRMVHHRTVRKNNVDCSPFIPALRQQAWTWLAPLCDCPELSKVVLAEILRQSHEAGGARFVDPKCLVTEGALFFCHKDVKHFFVGELAETVNLILKGRHEDWSLSPKAVGLILRELGLYGDRVAEGYKIVLTDAVRASIHRLAHDFQVALAQDGARRCRFCLGQGADSKQVQ